MHENSRKLFYKYHTEIIIGILGEIIAIIYYLIEKEAALSLAIGIIVAGFSLQAALIKLSVEEALKTNLELYNLQTSIDHPVFRMRAQKIIDVCIRDIRKLSHKTYEVYGAEPAFSEIMEFYKRARSGDTIRSVIVCENGVILDGIYFERHKDAIERGTNIIKIFIVPDEEIDRLREKIKKFTDSGIHTKLVPQKSIGSDNRLLTDFLIYNDIVIISSSDGRGLLRSIRISADPHDVDDYTHIFEDLLKIV